MASGGSKSDDRNKIPEWMSRGGQQNFGDAQAWNKANPITAYTGQLAPGVDRA
jgi:hypothetical protein